MKDIIVDVMSRDESYKRRKEKISTGSSKLRRTRMIKKYIFYPSKEYQNCKKKGKKILQGSKEKKIYIQRRTKSKKNK